MSNHRWIKRDNDKIYLSDEMGKEKKIVSYKMGVFKYNKNAQRTNNKNKKANLLTS